MTTLKQSRAARREWWLQRARETSGVLSTGLTVHATATALERRFEHLIGAYFRPGDVVIRPGMTVRNLRELFPDAPCTPSARRSPSGPRRPSITGPGRRERRRCFRMSRSSSGTRSWENKQTFAPTSSICCTHGR
jgi:hypothetical protein